MRNEIAPFFLRPACPARTLAAPATTLNRQRRAGLATSRSRRRRLLWRRRRTVTSARVRGSFVAANSHKYGSQLGRFTCWRAKDLAELRRAELSDSKRTTVGSSRPGGGRGGGDSFAAVASAPDRCRREEGVVGSGDKLVQREQRDVASRNERRTEEAPLQRSLSEDLDRLGGLAREAILRCVDPTRASPDCVGTNDFGLIFLPRSPSSVAASCIGGRNDVQPIADDDEDVEPLNLSVRRRESSSPVRQLAPSAAVGASRRAGVSSAADPEVEEHFRRSLGQRYPKGERARNGEVGSRSHIAASVEEHFLKSLGSAWLNAADGEASAPADVDNAARDTATAASTVLASSDGPAPVNCYSHGSGTAAGYSAGASALRQTAIVGGRKRSRVATPDRAPSLDCRRKSPASDRGLHMASRGAATPAAEAEDCVSDEGERWSPAAKRPCANDEQPPAQSSRQCRDGAEAAGLVAAAATPVAVSPTPASPGAATSPALASPAAANGISCDAKSFANKLPFPEQRQSPLTPATLPDSTTVGGGGDDCADSRPPSVGGHSGQTAERSLSPPGRASSVAAASATPSAATDAASVDEHFAKALGSKWAEIKRHLSAPPPATVRCERL